MERFFLNLKRVWQRDYVNPAEARTDITDEIVGLYNVRRIHSTCPMPSKNSAQQTPLGTQTKVSEKLDHDKPQWPKAGKRLQILNCSKV